MTHNDARLRWAGAVLYDHKAVIRDALYAELDRLHEAPKSNPDYYIKGSWRGDMHRRQQAASLREVRAALRDIAMLPMRTVAA